MSRKKVVAKRPTVRCAIYTRKSTEEGLDQEFNSLDAQRESAEAYIASQQHEGWVCLPDRYDDGGYTGGNMERPALRRLLVDIEAGRVDCVVVYKVDRLSRSLIDFAKMMETFEEFNIAFVSVTQQFCTAQSMGRLTLNILLSFAQYEREIISERTRDKIAAARRKGKWSGGMPLLGYDVDPNGSKLVVNRREAERVRQIFRMYLDRESLIATVKELNRRGWTTKCWTTRKGTRRGGRAFAKSSLHQLLTNVAYLGKVRYKSEVHEGEHEAIVDAELFGKVQAALGRNGVRGGSAVRNKHGAFLRSLLRCASCECAMTHTYTSKGSRQYRYYVCTHAQQRGWQQCPAPSIPAGEIEAFVVEQIKSIGRDPKVVAETIKEVRQRAKEENTNLHAERAELQRQVRTDNTELRRLADSRVANGDRVTRLADLHERLRVAERRLTEINEVLLALADEQVDEADVAAALAEFDTLWESLAPREQARVLELLIERVDYDGKHGNIAITFHPTGIKTLATELSRSEEHAA